MDLLGPGGEQRLLQTGGDRAQQRRPEGEAGEQLSDDGGQLQAAGGFAERPRDGEQQPELDEQEQQLVAPEGPDILHRTYLSPELRRQIPLDWCGATANIRPRTAAVRDSSCGFRDSSCR